MHRPGPENFYPTQLNSAYLSSSYSPHRSGCSCIRSSPLSVLVLGPCAPPPPSPSVLLHRGMRHRRLLMCLRSTGPRALCVLSPPALPRRVVAIPRAKCQRRGASSRHRRRGRRRPAVARHGGAPPPETDNFFLLSQIHSGGFFSSPVTGERLSMDPLRRLLPPPAADPLRRLLLPPCG